MNMKLKSDEDLTVFLCRFDSLVLQAKNAGAVLQDDVIINFLLNSLPNDYEKIKEDILDNTDNIPISLDKVTVIFYTEKW